MSAPVVWILAFASAVLLITGGFTIAVARFRGRVVAHRRQAAKLGAQLEGKPSDPFGELQVIGDQLRKIQQRLGESEEVAGLPVQSSAGAVSTSAPQLGTPFTGELEQDLDLFKKELYDKTGRIDELVTEKQLLAERIVTLESALAAAPAPAPVRKVKPTESNMALVDVLQAEADELRAQIAERDALLKSLEKSDTSGLVKEVGRIRQELMDRNEELNTLKAHHTDVGQLQMLQTKIQSLTQEKETIAARALETAGQLRQANERIGELEQALVSRQAVAFAGAAQAPPPSVTATLPGAGPMPPPAPPRVPTNPGTTPPPLPPPGAAARPPAPPTPRSPGFPDEPTVKTGAPRMTPVPKSRERRRTGSIFPAPRSKKDLLD